MLSPYPTTPSFLTRKQSRTISYKISKKAIQNQVRNIYPMVKSSPAMVLTVPQANPLK